MAGIVAVFDFDKTIIDLDSDNWVVDELGFTDLFNQLLPTMPWNTLMDTMMKELHSNGKTIDDIVKVLERVPIHPRIVPAIKVAHDLGHLGLMDYFSEINTNPSYVDEEGRLRIFPCHDFHSSPHGCNLCPPNMCKGMVMERIQASVASEGKKKFIYLGDGSGDFCPSLKLREGDHVMPRKDYPVWDLICKNRPHIKAEIHEWSDGEDLERVLLQLIHTISMEEANKLFAEECKFETIPMAAHESLPKAVSVPH
ncbi:inorganic pyrophosphatase 1 [Actinidia rufa]|uniref:Inorganic pyrophosphatase 1 n=1 Tax=Actinidia rufa TaxID=165716 RepID=A0A7J0FEL9_9ERIC|nr:inorganic pyrophosphatase 1 [Actinidia rufa]